MICFAVLAHGNEAILAQQVRNIKLYNPDSCVVVYNSSGDPNFAAGIKQIMICPYSRGPLAWGRTGRVLWDIAKWLKETQLEYDYLVYIDSDVLFIRHGFAGFLNKAMQRYDCMGVNMHQEFGPGKWIPGRTMWKEWPVWKKFFGTNYLCGMFANGQVYRKKLIQRMYDNLNEAKLERLLATTKVVALEEILHATLAVRSGGAFRRYPRQAEAFIRFRPKLKVADIRKAEHTANVFFVHPVKRSMNDPARRWIIDRVELPESKRNRHAKPLGNRTGLNHTGRKRKT